MWCRGGRRRETERFVDVHCGCQAGETAVIEVCGAPVVVFVVGGAIIRHGGGGFGSFACRRRHWKVVQQARLGRHAFTNHALKVAVLILWHILHSEAITRACHERRGGDDQIAEIRGRGPEAREKCFGGPEVRGGVFREGVVVLGGTGGTIEALRSQCWTAFEGGIFMEGGVDVVGALERVGAVVLELFSAEGPAG